MVDQEQQIIHLSRPGSQDQEWLASREKALRQVLRTVSQQRVSMLWNDASFNQTVATVEPSLPKDGIDLVVTCYMRGWLMPIGEMSTEGLIDWLPSDRGGGGGGGGGDGRPGGLAC